MDLNPSPTLLYNPGLAYRTVLKATVAYLHSALDNVEWADQGVGDSAGQDASHHAFGVVTEIVYV